MTPLLDHCNILAASSLTPSPHILPTWNALLCLPMLQGPADSYPLRKAVLDPPHPLQLALGVNSHSLFPSLHHVMTTVFALMACLFCSTLILPYLTFQITVECLS